MANPRSRSDAAPRIAFWARWRRNSNRSPGGDAAQKQDSRERFHRRAPWVVGSFLILVIVAVLAAGYKDKFWDPPRAQAGSVRGITFSMGDLVQRIRVVQGITGSADLTTLPFEYLQSLLHAEILRQESESLNINVDDEFIEQAVRAQHYPKTQSGQTSDPGQLDREYRNNLQIYLARTGLSEQEYRGILEETLQRQVLYFQLGADIPDQVEQVEVAWIRLELNGQITAPEVIARLENESFAEIAQTVSVSAGYADRSGYVGWVPPGAFREIGDLLFGNQKKGQRPLDVGATSRPLFTEDGIYIVHKISGLELREMTNVMGARVDNLLLEDWQREKLRQGTSEGWAKMTFNSDLYQWVADQLDVSAPRNASGGIGSQPAQR